MRRLIHCGPVLIVFALALPGQTLSFEVASIKPAAPVTQRGGRSNASADFVSYSNTTLLNVLARAYVVKGNQIDGPLWIKTERYDILAKAPDNTAKEQIPLMLQGLLAERFQLKLHREQREMQVYALLLGKAPQKFEKSDGDLSYGIKDGRRELKNHTIAQLADFISPMVQRMVSTTPISPGPIIFL